MNNTISTNVVKLNLKTILENYKKPEFWSKKWIIIDTKWLTLEWHITKIDCMNNKIESVVKVAKINYIRKKIRVTDLYYHYEWSCSAIPINNDEYTQTMFENNIFGTIIRLVEFIETCCLAPCYKEYKNADKQDDEYEETLREIAENFLDENKVTNEDIRNAYIESYISKVTENRINFSTKVANNFKGKLLTDVYIYAAAWFNNEEKFNEFKKFSKKRKTTFFEVRNEMAKIQTDEWKESMEKELEAV